MSQRVAIHGISSQKLGAGAINRRGFTFQTADSVQGPAQWRAFHPLSAIWRLHK
ncbi:MAG: hypothetical protein IT311_03295 [Anaerolineales bacterium]|nr:hypothetical protein [Anaerolineales bacterium]MCZ2120887.1 hypothetical protein [Anaerolineales bacterium]